MAIVNASALIAGRGGPTNYIRNPRLEGAVAGVIGSGGAYPTNWGTIGLTSHTKTIVGTGVDAATGLPYVDIQFSGTSAAGEQFMVMSLDTLNTPIAPLDQFGGSLYIALVGGDFTNILGLFTQARFIGGGSPASVNLMSSLTGNLQRFSTVFQSLSTSTAGQFAFYYTYPTTGVTVNITLRIAGPQFERAPYVSPMQILPPAGTPGVTNAPLIAIPPTILGQSRIDGRGGQTNLIRNPRLEGAIAASPGTLPTYWSSGAIAGLTRTITLGTDGATGLPYMDIRHVGTTAQAGSNIRFDSPSGIGANPGDTFALSAYVALVAGTLTNITQIDLAIYGSNGIVNVSGPNRVPITLTGTLQRFSGAITLATLSTITNVWPVIDWQCASGVAVDFTLRIAGPQIEYGPATTAVDLPPAGFPGPSDNPLSPDARVFTTPVLISAGGGITNAVFNPNMEGAVVGVIGSGGVIPTTWSMSATLGLIAEIINTGVSDPVMGLPYLDFRLSGTVSATGAVLLRQAIPASVPNVYALFPTIGGDVSSQSIYAQIVGGSTAGVTNFGQVVYWTDNNGVATTNTAAAVFTPTATLQRFSINGRVATANANTRRGYTSLWFSLTLGNVVDFTLRIIAPQLENSPVATPPILPPLGSPGFTTRGLLAMPVIGNWAEIDGVASVRADGRRIVFASAQINGVGGVRADLRRLVPVGAVINGGEGNRINPLVAPAPNAPNTCVISTAVPPPFGDTSLVFMHTMNSTTITACGLLGIGTSPPLIPYTLNAWVWVPAGWGGTLIEIGPEGAGSNAGYGLANLSLTNQWQLLSVQSYTPTANFNLVIRATDATASPFYSSVWQAVPNTVVAEPNQNTAAVARIPGVADADQNPPNILMRDGAVAAGVAGLRADGTQIHQTFPANATIGGVGSFRANATRLLAASVEIDGAGGGEMNFCPNPRCEGAVSGTPGTLPTYWALNALSGISQQVIGSGIDAGTSLPYVDVRYFGTFVTTNYVVAGFNLFTGYLAPTNIGTTWTASAYVALVGGSLTNVASLSLNIRGSQSIGSGVTTFMPTAALTRYTNVSIPTAITDNLQGGYTIVGTVGLAIDLTLRFGPHQLETGAGASAQIYPPVGWPQWSSRDLDSGVAVLDAASARIAGVGSVSANAQPMRDADASIGGVGGVAASAQPMRAANARIDGAGDIDLGVIAVLARAQALIGGAASVQADTITSTPRAAATLIGGVGSFRATAQVLMPAFAEIDGVGESDQPPPQVRASTAAQFGGLGSVRATAQVLALSGAVIVGGEKDVLALGNAGAVAPNTCVVSTDIPAPPPGGATVFKNTRVGTTGDSNSGYKATSGLQVFVPYTLSAWMWVPAGWGGTAIELHYEGSNPFHGYASANLSLTNQWQLVSFQDAPPYGDISVVVRPTDATATPFYTALYRATPDTVTGAAVSVLQASAQINGAASVSLLPTGAQLGIASIAGVGSLSANAVPARGAFATVAGVGGVAATATVLAATAAEIDGQGGQTNYIRNPRAEGAIPGTPGTLPTFWTISGLSSVAQQVVGSGVDAATGLPYVDIRIFGTAPTSTIIQFYVEPNSYLNVAIGDVTVMTGWFALVGGSTTSMSQILFGTYIITPSQLTATLQPFGPVSNPASAAGPVAAVMFRVFGTAGPVDYTLRLAGFQLELDTRTPPILPPVGAPQITTRALLAMPNTAIPGIATIPGVGSVSDDGRRLAYAYATIAGTGSVAADGTQIHQTFPASATIAGVGSVTAPATALRPVAATIAGVASFAANGLGAQPTGNQLLAGVGSVTATATVRAAAAAEIDGVGGKSNYIRNPRGDYAVVGTPGTLPLRWTEGGSGFNRQVVGFGVDAATGLNYVDVRYFSSGSGGPTLYFDDNVSLMGLAGDTFVSTVWLAMVGGSLTNIFGVSNYLSLPGSASAGGAITLNATLTPYVTNGTVTTAGVLGLPCWIIVQSFGGGFDITLRIAGIQLERTPATPLILPLPGLPQVSTRALLAMPTVRDAASVRIDGVGTITTDANPVRVAAARLQGVASVQPIGAALDTTTATIAGLGSVQATVTGVIPALATIAGVATVSANALRLVPAACAIAGQGGVQALSGVSGAGLTLTIAGVGGVRAPGQIAAPVAATITGAGSVRADGTQVHQTLPVSATIAGIGLVRATAGVPALAQARIAGTGSLRIAGTLPVHVAARIDGVGHISVDGLLRGQQAAQARINGVASVSANALVRFHAASARIDGAGNVHTITKSPAVALSTMVASYTPAGGARNDFDGDLGFIFTPIADQHVNWIGLLCPQNPSGLHTVRIFDGPTLTTVRSATIDLTGKTPGQWYYVGITDITLVAGRLYYVNTVVTAYDGQLWANEGPTTVKNASNVFSAYSSNTGAFPTASLANAQLFGVDLAEGAVAAASDGVIVIMHARGGRIRGTGTIAAISRTVRPGGARIHGIGAAVLGVGDRMRDARSLIAGRATFKAISGIEAPRFSVAAIDGVGTVHATAVVHVAWQASARIGGDATVKGSHDPGGAKLTVTARLAGTGSLAVTSRPHRPGDIELDAEGWLAADAHVRAAGQARVGGLGALAASVSHLVQTARARIAGLGTLDPEAGIARAAATTLHGAGHLAASATVLHRKVQANSSIHGVGTVHAIDTATAAPHAQARIAGTGTLHVNVTTVSVLPAARVRIAVTGRLSVRAQVIAHVIARIAGAAQLRAGAFKPLFQNDGKIHGVGNVRARAAVLKPVPARIAGHATVTAHATLVAGAHARISGLGLLRARLRVLFKLHGLIHGVGTVHADATPHRQIQARARIAGEGMVAPDGFAPRDRVARYGVHLPPTARSVSLSAQPPTDEPVSLPPTRRSVLV